MFKSPLIFGVALLAGWVLLASGAITSLAGVAPVANPPHVVVVETLEVIAPPALDVADAAVPSAQPTVSAPAPTSKATL
jgi:multidrug efflux pump subunit AcrA (membrane-fusion protein)